MGSCVTDNASNMVLMRNLVAVAKPEIVCYGCQAHWVNLLMKDVSEIHGTIMERVVEVFRWLRNTHAALAALRARGLTMPPMPTATRSGWTPPHGGKLAVGLGFHLLWLLWPRTWSAPWRPRAT